MPEPQAEYYGQYGEDYLVHQLFEESGPGFYVDLGAFDGVHLSNTYAFEKLGWDGICVEPHPAFFPLLVANRPGATCVNAAVVAAESGPTVALLAEPLGLFSCIEGESPTNLRRGYARRGLSFPGFESTEVAAITLDRLLDEHAPGRTRFELLSLDTNGNELAILAAFRFERHAPLVVIVEANTDEAGRPLVELMRARGYTLARAVKVNLVFCSRPDDAETLRRTPIRCRIADTRHPLGDDVTPERLRGREIDEERELAGRRRRAP